MWLFNFMACSCLTCHFAAGWPAIKSSRFPPAAFTVLATLARWVSALTEKCVVVAVVALRRPLRGSAGSVITSGLDDSCLLYQSEDSYARSISSVSESLKYCLRLNPSDCHSVIADVLFSKRIWVVVVQPSNHNDPTSCGRWILDVDWTLLNHVCMV